MVGPNPLQAQQLTLQRGKTMSYVTTCNLKFRLTARTSYSNLGDLAGIHSRRVLPERGQAVLLRAHRFLCSGARVPVGSEPQVSHGAPGKVVSHSHPQYLRY